MGSMKKTGEKVKLMRLGKIARAPRWADIKKFGLKRARRRMIRVASVKLWRRGKNKI